jgi:hypothetical protein
MRALSHLQPFRKILSLDREKEEMGQEIIFSSTSSSSPSSTFNTSFGGDNGHLYTSLGFGGSSRHPTTSPFDNAR